METTRRTFLGGLAVASVPAISIAMPAPETLEDRIERLKAELLAALDEKWPRGAEILKCPGKYCIVYVQNDKQPVVANS
ncbi:hypothetical protein [Shinella sp.]|uniref:hypothetical protein n=1 Tax=Shinella sp. TaxID=1870904 RepID=UPI0029B8FB99|nr:hypothetical protein [Shinella sp.]MDX3977019.1 hypothetical protein [Shinella sp.]